MLILEIVQEVYRQCFEHGSNIGGTVPQDNCDGCQVSLQQRLQDVLNDRVRPKRQEGFEAPHTARFPGRQHNAYDAHKVI
jgi:hypothetical protein